MNCWDNHVIKGFRRCRGEKKWGEQSGRGWGWFFMIPESRIISSIKHTSASATNHIMQIFFSSRALLNLQDFDLCHTRASAYTLIDVPTVAQLLHTCAHTSSRPHKRSVRVLVTLHWECDRCCDIYVQTPLKAEGCWVWAWIKPPEDRLQHCKIIIASPVMYIWVWCP